MAAEPDSPKTGMIAWVTAISLVMIFVTFVALQGLFNMWEIRHDKRTGLGIIETPLTQYQKEQESKLNDLDAAAEATLADAKAGKVLAAPPPPATPAASGTGTAPGKK